MKRIQIQDVPKRYRENVSILGTVVELSQQRTGYGYKRFFLCPHCGSRRADLYLHEKNIYCRSCLPFDLYHRRRNLYDEGGGDLVVWHMQKIAKSAKIPLQFPFKYYNYLDYLNTKPPKKYEALRLALAKLQMLENMRFGVIFFHHSFTAKQIKEFIAPAFISQFNLWQIEHYCIFTGQYSPYEARSMMRESPFS